MKLPLPIHSGSRRLPTTRSAFTVAEIMTAMGLFSLVVIGVVYSQRFGMRTFNITSTRVVSVYAGNMVFFPTRNRTMAL
jgi:hypothetical protein